MISAQASSKNHFISSSVIMLLLNHKTFQFLKTQMATKFYEIKSHHASVNTWILFFFFQKISNSPLKTTAYPHWRPGFWLWSSVDPRLQWMSNCPRGTVPSAEMVSSSAQVLGSLFFTWEFCPSTITLFFLPRCSQLSLSDERTHGVLIIANERCPSAHLARTFWKVFRPITCQNSCLWK